MAPIPLLPLPVGEGWGEGSCTVTIVKDVLADLFGYDKYSEVTAEHTVRGTYCDLAIKIENQVRLLIEVKAVGLDLKESHVRQAVDYAANQGMEWVVLTNGIVWKVFRVGFGKPISQELVFAMDLLDLNPRNSVHVESLFLLTRRGLLGSALVDYHAQRQALDKFTLAAILLSDPMLKMARRELRRLAGGITVGSAEIKDVLEQEVLKREVVEGDGAEEARKKVQRTIRRRARRAAPSERAGEETEPGAAAQEAETPSEGDG